MYSALAFIRRKGAALLLSASLVGSSGLAVPLAGAQSAPSTATPIQHVVVIFQENASFDHYFGTYPMAANPVGEPAFTAAANTPTVNGLNQTLLTHNPNLANPSRLDRSQPITCDMDHGYTAEQAAFDGGLMDKFVQSTGATSGKCDPKQVMDYYDGNSVTALWNYAQHYAMSDNSYGTTFGPSTPGALNLVSGQTAGATPANVTSKGAALVQNGTVVDDLDPTYDDCSAGPTAALTDQNVGDLLNAKNLTWGWFQGGFRPTNTNGDKAVCAATSTNVAGAKVADYSAHHEPFEYYKSTSNPHHLPPTSTALIGQTDQANHQYDLTDFYTALAAGNLPAVTFLKAKKFQDGHPGYSDPLDEQAFLVTAINAIQQSPFWSSTAIFINYDDSDGWYDHVMGPIVNQSNTALDVLNGAGNCGAAASGAPQGRCGYGPRIPMMTISPYARINFVDHAVSDQSSILRFVEDNWSLGRIGGQSYDALAGPLNTMFDFGGAARAGTLILDPTTGEPQVGSGGAATANALQSTQTGTLAGNGGGSFAYYQIAQPSGASVHLTLTVGSLSPTDAHRIGLNAYQAGAKLGSVTLTSTDLGDSSTSNTANLTVSPSSAGGTVSIQVYNYSSGVVTYTLTQS